MYVSDQDTVIKEVTENRKPRENDEQQGAIKTVPEVEVRFLFLIILITCAINTVPEVEVQFPFLIKLITYQIKWFDIVTGSFFRNRNRTSTSGTVLMAPCCSSFSLGFLFSVTSFITVSCARWFLSL
jgi:hypothetical protein